MIAIILIVSFGLFIAAYFIYSRYIAKMYHLDCEAKTPATEMNDGVDYIPTNKWYLLAQHFSKVLTWEWIMI